MDNIKFKILDFLGFRCALLRCQACNSAYYCSKECQRKHCTSTHHANYCEKRAKEGFLENDICQLVGYHGVPELNGCLVRVLEGSAIEGRWQVETMSKCVKVRFRGKLIKGEKLVVGVAGDNLVLGTLAIPRINRVNYFDHGPNMHAPAYLVHCPIT